MKESNNPKLWFPITDDAEFNKTAEEAWNESAEVKLANADIDEAFDSFRMRTGQKKTEVRKIWFSIASAAASVAVILGFYAGFATGSSKVAQPIVSEWIECRTGHGQNNSILLSDGSRIWVNAASRVLYPETFVGDKREIYLSGEAYLEIAKDSLRPFFVNAGDMKIKVTGTKFNVKAYADDSIVTTTLMEGGVEVTVPEQPTPIALTPGNSLSFDRENNELNLYPVQFGMYPSWYKGEFNAYHMTLEQITKDLERRFGVKIVIRNHKIAQEMFYASFVNHESVDEILSLLNIDGEFVIQRNENIIDIY